MRAEIRNIFFSQNPLDLLNDVHIFHQSLCCIAVMEYIVLGKLILNSQEMRYNGETDSARLRLFFLWASVFQLSF